MQGKKKKKRPKPVHDVGQSVQTDRVSGKHSGVKDAWRRHDHQGKAKLQEGVTHLRKKRELMHQFILLTKLSPRVCEAS